MKEAIEMCPALVLAEGYRIIPPAACRRGLTPEVVDGVVFADSRCDFVVAQLTNEHCEKISEVPLKIGQATPELLAQPRQFRT